VFDGCVGDERHGVETIGCFYRPQPRGSDILDFIIPSDCRILDQGQAKPESLQDAGRQPGVSVFSPPVASVSIPALLLDCLPFSYFYYWTSNADIN
jgi:hypothetical protein